VGRQASTTNEKNKQKNQRTQTRDDDDDDDNNPGRGVDNQTTHEQERPDAQQGHDPDELGKDGVEGARFGGAEEVVPAEQAQAEHRAQPRVDQEEQKVLEVAQSHAVVHPRTCDKKEK
jgi:hypothetical protein